MTESAPAHEVRLIQLPVLLWTKAEQHAELVRLDMQRLAEHLRDQPLSTALTPLRFEATTARMRAAHDPDSYDLDRVVAAAAAAGETSIDAIVRLPADAGPSLVALAQSLDEVDDYCRRGAYSLLVTPADCKRLRDWFFRECLTQLDGGAPTPWTDYAGAA